MTEQLRVVVVGGGIAGLTAAVAVLRAGWGVTVLERSPEFAEVGAGLAVTDNGMAALGAIGLDDAVRAVGERIFMAGTQDRNGRWLLRIPAAEGAAGSLMGACGVHRQRLHAVLLQAAGRAELIHGADAVAVRPGAAQGEQASVAWRSETGTHSAQCDLVVAADGMGSSIRQQLFPQSRLRYSGKSCWRAVVRGTDRVGDGFTVRWGPGTEFGALRISDTEVYWYGYFKHPARSAFENELEAARDHFSDWTPDVREIVGRTQAGALMRHDVYHLPSGLPRYVHGRVAVIGDAAHALLPTMGQGANTSLEDGVSLGQLVAEPVACGAELESALADFDHARRPRCAKIARRSAMTERIGSSLTSNWQQALRNSLMRLTPAGPAARAGAEVLRWSPP